MSTLITISTCEDLAKNNKGYLLEPTNNQSLDLFSIHDPFGIRQAVVPVLLMGADGIMCGMGTAFHVDGWGTFLTADHVVHTENPDFYDPKKELRTSSEYTPVLILGVGLIYGRIGLPPEAIANVVNVDTPVHEKDDPLRSLKGHESIDPIDLAILKTQNVIPININKTLPIRITNKAPKEGDIVVAIGYPDFKCQPVDETYQRYLLSDGMHAAYGKVIKIHHEGRGSKTPIIEVEANWPGGMSGGPVFNANGEVIGIVSKSIEPSGGLAGNGSAVSLASLPKLNEWLPSLNLLNPRWRQGWLASCNDAFDTSLFFKTKEEAVSAATALGKNFRVTFCSHKLGSDELIF